MSYSIRKSGNRWCLYNSNTGRRYGCHDSEENAKNQQLAVEKNHRENNSRHVVLRGAVGEIRTAKFQDKEHIVLPVIALVEGVIWPSNAPEPELVLADSFSVAPQGWNGRPVFHGHPKQNGASVSGNTPDVLVSAVGTVFNAGVDAKRLKMEAWLDPTRADRTEDGKRLLERVRALQSGKGDPIEVSVGAYVTVAETAGSLNGKKYACVWQSITPDHLALLSEDEIGACSVEAGCGAPRTNSIHTLTAKGFEFEDTVQISEPMSLKDRVLSYFSFLQNPDTMSDIDVRRALQAALSDRSTTGQCYIEAVYADHIIYSEWDPENGIHYYSLGYELSDSGKISLKHNQIEVQPTLVYESLEMITARGARHSASDLKKLQSMHDYATELGATCYGMKASSQFDDLDEDAIEFEDSDPADYQEFVNLRDIPQSERDKMSSKDFAGPHQSFPIEKPEDVIAAAHSLGRAKGNRAAIKAKIIAIAYRKGPEFVAKLPDGWKRGADTKAASKHNCSCQDEGDKMKTREERIAALIANSKSGFVEADKKMLEAATDDRLTQMEVATAKIDEAAVARTKRIEALIDNPKSGFTKIDEKMLEAASDDRLAAFEAAINEPKKEEPKKEEIIAATEKKGEPVEKKEEPKPKTDEEFLAEAPAEIREMVTRQRAIDTARRTELVAFLAKNQKEYSEDELKEMKLPDLERVNRLLGNSVKPNFTGLTPRQVVIDENRVAPPPIDLNARLREQKSA